MKYKKLYVMVLVVALLFCQVEAEKISIGEHEVIQQKTITDNDRELWSKTLEKYLVDNLWVERDIYDAGHVLMPTLHAAFRFEEMKWQKAYSEHFNRFVREIEKEDNDVSLERLSRLHYLYAASQFLILAQQNDQMELVPEKLYSILHREIDICWNQEAWQWDRKPFGGMGERIRWKLATKDVQRSYYRAIIDEELFVFAIAADLKMFERNANIEQSTLLDEVISFADEVFVHEVQIEPDGRWLFQPGVWADHPDYAFAQHTDKMVGMEPLKRPQVAMDSSHGHRFPLWIKSLSKAHDEGSVKNEYYTSLLEGLAMRFLLDIIVPPSDEFPGYRMNNFMDGWNGVFRWGYATTGEGRGYGPFELSGTLISGWWGMLNHSEIGRIFNDIYLQYPLTEKAISVYVGPNTTRDRNPLVTWPDFFANGFSELNVSMMWKMAED